VRWWIGRRGFDPVKPKQCGNATPAYLKLLERVEHSRVDHEEGYKTTVDYKIQCLSCTNIFYVRLRHVFQKLPQEDKRVTTVVNILDEQKQDLGWLGNY